MRDIFAVYDTLLPKKSWNTATQPNWIR